MIITWSVEGWHIPFVISHTKIFSPISKLVTKDTLLDSSSMLALLFVVQIPSPITGLEALIVSTSSQVSVLSHVYAIVGSNCLIIITWSVAGGQVPLIISQTKIFSPPSKFIAEVLLLYWFVNVAFPMVVHCPVPTTAWFASKLILSAQSSCSLVVISEAVGIS